MSSSQHEPGIKEYDGKATNEPFYVVAKGQSFVAELYRFTAKAPKEYRITICRKVQDYGMETIHLTRLANKIRLGDPLRLETQEKAVECIERVNDLIPVLRILHCMSEGQEQELQKHFGPLRESFRSWMMSDKKRLENQINKG